MQRTAIVQRSWAPRVIPLCEADDDARFNARTRHTLLMTGGAKAMVLPTHDTGAAESHELKFARLYRLYAVLSHVNQAIVRQDSREEVLASVCRILVEDGGFRMAWIGWLDPASMRIAPVASFGDDDHYLAQIEIYADDRPEARGPTGTAFREERPYVCNDLRADPAALRWRAEAERRGYRSSAALVIREAGQVRGTLSVYASESGVFQDREVAMLGEVAADVSLGLDILAGEDAHREAERALASTTAMLERTEAKARVGGWELDLRTNAVTWSREMYRIHDMEPGTPVDDAMAFSSYPADAAAEVRATFQAGIDHGKSWDFVQPITTARGRKRWVQAQGDAVLDDGIAIKLVGTLQDITDRVEAEEVASRLAAIVESSQDAIIGKDLAGIVTSWNPGAERLFGYSATEMIGQPISRLIPVDRRDEESMILARVGCGEAVRHYETVRMRRDGTEVHVSATLSAIKDAAGRIIGASKVAHDITFEKQAELVLGASELRYRRLFETAKDGILILDADTGMVVDVNPFLTQLLGFSHHEFLGKTVWDLGFLRDFVANAARFDELLAKEYVRYENLPLETRSGERIEVEFVSNVYEVSGRKVVQCNVRDVSDRHRAEVANKESQERYRTLFENSPDGIAVARDGKVFVDANANLCRMLGYTRAELIGQPTSMILPERDHPTMGEWGGLLKEAPTHQFERWLRRKDGSEVRVDAIVSMLPDGSLQSTIRDITERKEAEAALRDAALRISGIVDAAMDAIITIDADQRIVLFNPAAERMFGHARETILGVSIDLLIPAAARDAHGGHIRRFEQAGTTSRRMGARDEISGLRASGEIFPIEASISQTEVAGKKLLTVILRDVTERKKLEQQFLRAQRMESVGTLAGGIAHDLNNALTPIIMSIELLKMTFTDDDSQELITSISRSAQHGADMVRQLLSFARGVEGQRVEVPLRHLVLEIEKIARDTFLKSVQVRTIVARDLWTVLGDATQIHQVLMNLCVNARDAMPGGGRLVITAENVELDAQDAATNLDVTPGPYVVIQVEDSGEGMSPAVIEKIFDPFFTTKEVGVGTGLGLSTSLAIVQSNGGFLRVYSEPGNGTKFTVYLPAQTVPSDIAPTREGSLPRGRGELILVVDDEPSVRQVTQQTLEAFGYQVLAAQDGTEAVALYAARGKEIAVVLTDIMMPVMDGLATIRVLRKLNPGVCIIAASGLYDHAHAAVAASLGIAHFLPKPFHARALLNVLRDCLGGSGAPSP